MTNSERHAFEIASREANIRKLAGMDSDPEGAYERAASLFRATIRHANDYHRLTDAQNDSANYSSAWKREQMRRWEARHERHEGALQKRWGAYGLRMSWPGVGWPTIDKASNGPTIGWDVIDLVPYC